MESDVSEGVLRIGELSRRTGVSDHLLRSWEARYHLLQPQRSEGGFRLYSLHDQARVQTMKSLLDQGLSPAQAAKIASSPQAQEQWTATMMTLNQAMPAPRPAPTGPWPAQTTPTPRPTPSEAAQVMVTPAPVTPAHVADSWKKETQEVLEALTSFDDRRANTTLDRLLADYSTDTVLREIIIPLISTIGTMWSTSHISIAREHYASSWIRARLGALSRGWSTGEGPIAVVASPEGELHDLGGLAFGISLHRHGWRIIHLGANMPVKGMNLGGNPLPDLVMISAVNPTPLEIQREALTQLSSTTRVYLAGAGAHQTIANETGCTYIADDPITAARQIANAE